MLATEAVGMFITRALVVVEMLKMLPEVEVETLLIMLATVMLVLDWRFLEASVVTKEEAVRVAMLMLLLLVICRAKIPVEDATRNKSKAGRVDVPCTIKLETSVVVPMATEPLALILNKEMPVEVLTWKGFRVVVPWTNKDAEEDEALTPATVPLSIRTPVDRAEADVHLAA